MFIINKKGEIFNTDCIRVITVNPPHVLAVWDNTPRVISYTPEDIETIAGGIRNFKAYVEVN